MGNRSVKVRTKVPSEQGNKKERGGGWEKINPQPSFLVINHPADILKVRSTSVENPQDGRYGPDNVPGNSIIVQREEDEELRPFGLSREILFLRECFRVNETLRIGEYCGLPGVTVEWKLASLFYLIAVATRSTRFSSPWNDVLRSLIFIVD